MVGVHGMSRRTLRNKSVNDAVRGDDGRHAVGDAVELHTKFDGSWCTGFEIAEVRSGDYRVRRRHDRMLLPEPTGEDDLRAARRIS